MKEKYSLGGHTEKWMKKTMGLQSIVSLTKHYVVLPLMRQETHTWGTSGRT